MAQRGAVWGVCVPRLDGAWDQPDKHMGFSYRLPRFLLQTYKKDSLCASAHPTQAWHTKSKEDPEPYKEEKESKHKKKRKKKKRKPKLNDIKHPPTSLQDSKLLSDHTHAAQHCHNICKKGILMHFSCIRTAHVEFRYSARSTKARGAAPLAQGAGEDGNHPDTANPRGTMGPAGQTARCSASGDTPGCVPTRTFWSPMPRREAALIFHVSGSGA